MAPARIYFRIGRARACNEAVSRRQTRRIGIRRFFLGIALAIESVFRFLPHRMVLRAMRRPGHLSSISAHRGPDLRGGRVRIAVQSWAALVLAAVIAQTWAASDVGVTPTSIVIGQSADLSGINAKLTNDYLLGARTYFQSVNDAGGVNGRKIDLHTLDDASSADRARQNITDLIQKDQVFALFGLYGARTTEAALPILTAAKVPLIAPVTGSLATRDPVSPLVFNARASYVEEAEHVIDQLTATGITNFSVFYQADEFGHAGVDAVGRALNKRKLRMNVTATIDPDKTDATHAAKIFMGVRPAAIVVVANYAASASLVKQMRSDGYTGQFINLSSVGSTQLAEALGNAGTGVIMTQVMPVPWTDTTPLQHEYITMMRKAGLNEGSFSSIEGFIAAKLFVTALRRVSGDVTRQKLVDALDAMRPIDLGGYPLSYQPSDHNGSKYVGITILSASGKFVK